MLSQSLGHLKHPLSSQPSVNAQKISSRKPQRQRPCSHFMSTSVRSEIGSEYGADTDATAVRQARAQPRTWLAGSSQDPISPCLGAESALTISDIGPVGSSCQVQAVLPWARTALAALPRGA